ncbi:MAG: ribonuclease P protein component [Bacteroidota bacterium]
MPQFTFTKAERLKSKKVIGNLFKQGQSLSSYPLRIVWIPIQPALSSFPVQFSLTVPRRSFPKAVHRNRLRRLLREAYRLNKHWLYEQLPDDAPQYGIMLIYIAKEELIFAQVESAVQRIIRKWIKQLTIQNNSSH